MTADKLAALLALCEGAGSWHKMKSFMKQVVPNATNDYIAACSPDVVAALVRVVVVMRETHSNYRTHDGCEECATMRALDAALGDKL